MDPIRESSEQRPCWFVGASYGRTDDQTERFLKESIWENGYHDRHLDQVKSMRPGDRIAIKAAFTKSTTCPSPFPKDIPPRECTSRQSGLSRKTCATDVMSRLTGPKSILFANGIPIPTGRPFGRYGPEKGRCRGLLMR